MDAPSFSVVLITRNEAHKLPALFASLQEFRSRGGEVVVVDTGSEDDTAGVAREAGARVEIAGPRFHSVLGAEQATQINAKFSRNGEGPFVEAGQVLFDFGAARHYATQLASNEFVWQIDASDVVVAADLDFLDSSVRSGAAVFYYFLNLGGARFIIARFIDRRLFTWRGRVHEAPFGNAEPMNVRRITCTEEQLSLRHLQGEKTRNYFAGLALDALEFPAVPRWKHYVGRELYYMRHYRSALPWLRDHARNKRAPAVERGLSHCYIAGCEEALGRTDAAAESYLRATMVDPSRREPLLKLAALCQKRGDLQGSVNFAAAALQVPAAASFVDAEEVYTWHAHAFLYWGLFWLGRRDEARAHWEICRRMAPDDEKFRADARLFPD